MYIYIYIYIYIYNIYIHTYTQKGRGSRAHIKFTYKYLYGTSALPSSFFKFCERLPAIYSAKLSSDVLQYDFQIFKDIRI